MRSAFCAPPAASRRVAIALACLLAIAGFVVGAGAPAASAAESGPVGGERLGRPGVVYQPAPGVPAPPTVPATSYVLADTGTGDVLAAKSAHLRLRPASTQKMLTALVLLPRLSPQQVYTSQYDDAAIEGSKVGIVPDAPYTVHDLFLGLFLVSGNDATTALAHAAGGVPQTVQWMREKAHELQADDTVVVNPTGLDAPGQLSSAYDLALIARAALQRPDFRAYCSTVKAQFPGKVVPGRSRPTFQIFTQDKLLLNYRGAIGVKTGYTTQARNTFVGAATRNGRTLVVTLMHSGPGSWKEAAALLDWGFAHASTVTPVGRLVDPLGTGTAAAARPAVAGVLPPVPGVGEWSPPWWLWALTLVLGSVVALRTRAVVVRNRRRRRGRRRSRRFRYQSS